jgi:effector-binding domain-containing protein
LADNDFDLEAAMTYECEFKDQPAQPVLSIRTHAAVQDLPKVFGQAYGAIMQYLGELGEQPSGMPFAAYYNMDMQNLDLEIGFPVARQLPGRGEVQAGALPGGKWATVLHVGPYDQVGPAYDALSEAVKAEGFEATGVAYESFFDGPETPPEKTRTLVMFPLKA